MQQLEGWDLYFLDDLLTEEQRLVRRTVRTFVEKEVLPWCVNNFRRGTFPDSLIPRMAALGLLGANLTGYGCAGMDAVAYGLAQQELERADSGLRSFVSVQGALCMFPIHRFGSANKRNAGSPQWRGGRCRLLRFDRADFRL